MFACAVMDDRDIPQSRASFYSHRQRRREAISMASLSDATQNFVKSVVAYGIMYSKGTPANVVTTIFAMPSTAE